MAALPKTPQPVDEFWQWALLQWRRSELSTLLLQCQNQHGLVVLELLLLAWLGCRGHRLEPSLWRHMVSAVAPWVEDVIVPLRSTRQRWHDQPTATTLRPLLADLELRAERQLAELYIQQLSHLFDAGFTQANTHASGQSTDHSPLYDNLCLGASRAQPSLSEHKITEIVRLLRETDKT